MSSPAPRCLRARLPLAGVALGLLLAAPAAALKAWDQETVTMLAAQLAEATGQLRETIRREPHIQDAIDRGDRNAQSFWATITGLDKSARQLAARTSKGGGYERTLPIAKKIRTQVRDADTTGARLMSTKFMEQRIVPVQQLLARLDPYFF